MALAAAVSPRIASVGRSMLARYLAVGAVKVVIDFAVFNIVLLDTSSPGIGRVLAANTAGFVVAGGATYVLHAAYTFRVAGDRGAFARYLLVSLVGLVLYNGVLVGLVTLTDPGSVAVVNVLKLIALAASVGWNLFGAWRLVFRIPTVTENSAEPTRTDRSDAA